MTITVQMISNFLDAWAPPDTAANWDNVGLQLGDPTQPVTRLLIALDINTHVMNRLNEQSYDLIVTHHPLFFKPIRQIATHRQEGRIIQHLLATNTAVWSAHTNLDRANGGINDALIQYFGYDPKEATIIQDYVKVVPNSCGYTLKKLSAIMPVSRPIDSEDVPKMLGFCAGSAKSFIPALFECGIDVLITGELGYHEEQACQLENFRYLILGHAESEQIGLSEIRRRLRAEYSNLDIDIVG